MQGGFIAKSDKMIYRTQIRRAYVYIFPGYVWQWVLCSPVKRLFCFVFDAIVCGYGWFVRQLSKDEKKQTVQRAKNA